VKSPRFFNRYLLAGLVLAAAVGWYYLWPVRAKLPIHGGEIVDVTTSGGTRFVLSQHYNFSWEKPYRFALHIQQPGKNQPLVQVWRVKFNPDGDAWLNPSVAERRPHRLQFFENGNRDFSYDASSGALTVPASLGSSVSIRITP